MKREEVEMEKLIELAKGHARFNEASQWHKDLVPLAIENLDDGWVAATAADWIRDGKPLIELRWDLLGGGVEAGMAKEAGIYAAWREHVMGVLAQTRKDFELARPVILNKSQRAWIREIADIVPDDIGYDALEELAREFKVYSKQELAARGIEYRFAPNANPHKGIILRGIRKARQAIDAVKSRIAAKMAEARS